MMTNELAKATQSHDLPKSLDLIPLNLYVWGFV